MFGFTRDTSLRSAAVLLYFLFSMAAIRGISLADKLFNRSPIRPNNLTGARINYVYDHNNNSHSSEVVEIHEPTTTSRLLHPTDLIPCCIAFDVNPNVAKNVSFLSVYQRNSATDAWREYQGRRASLTSRSQVLDTLLSPYDIPLAGRLPATRHQNGSSVSTCKFIVYLENQKDYAFTLRDYIGALVLEFKTTISFSIDSRAFSAKAVPYLSGDVHRPFIHLPDMHLTRGLVTVSTVEPDTSATPSAPSTVQLDTFVTLPDAATARWFAPVALPDTSATPSAPSTVQLDDFVARPAFSTVQLDDFVARPAPSVGRPAPSVGRPAPFVGRPAFSTVQLDDFVARPAPSVALPAPSVARPDTSVARPAPSVGRPAPSVALPDTSVARPAPSVALLDTPVVPPAAVVIPPAIPVVQPAADSGSFIGNLFATCKSGAASIGRGIRSLFTPATPAASTTPATPAVPVVNVAPATIPATVPATVPMVTIPAATFPALNPTPASPSPAVVVTPDATAPVQPAAPASDNKKPENEDSTWTTVGKILAIGSLVVGGIGLVGVIVCFACPGIFA